MAIYDHKKIEEKWIAEWIDKKTYSPDISGAKNPYYNLMMFPYPSAEGLHVGNMYAFTGADVFGRYQRMKGNDVFEPIGLDGFGIHSENYAIKVGKHPAEQAKISEERFYKQLARIGSGYAWDHRLETYDPEYYKWTQWLFTKMYENGLAYRKKASVNWCPSCMTVLADEQVEDGKCERCKNETTKKETEQWFFKITQYADRLLANIDKLDWPNKIKTAQTNWIGKKTGINITYSVVRSENEEEVASSQASRNDVNDEVVGEVVCFTTTPVNWGATFLVLAPEYELVKKILDGEIDSPNKDSVQEYVDAAMKKSEQQRKEEVGNKTGVDTGLFAINHVDGKKIPIWISDFVLKDIGTGAVQGCPAHDERDFDFARKFGLPIRCVVRSITHTHSIVMKKSVPDNFEDVLSEKGWYTMDFEGFGIGVVVPKGDERDYIKLVQDNLKDGPWFVHADGVYSGVIFKDKVFTQEESEKAKEYAKTLSISDEQLNWDDVDDYMFCNTDGGVFVNSDPINGMEFKEGLEKTKDLFEERGWGKRVVSYSLRDWLISRQRYWGPPIPMVHCESCASKKKKVFIVHGTWGSGEDNWFPWLEEYLAQYGVEVMRPSLPDTKEPTYEKRMAYIEENYFDKIDENTIIIGHSSGSQTALDIVEKKKVGGVFLVAPVMSVNNEYKDKLSGFFDEKTGEALYELYNRPLDEDKIVENSGPIKVLFGENDPYLPKSFIDDAKEKYGSSSVFVLDGYGHFSSDDPKEFFDLLKYLPMNEIQNPGWYAVEDESLPVELPELDDYKPTGDGKAPLARAGEEFLHTDCPQCGGVAKREIDVSDTFLDSSWYFLRYPSLHGNDADSQPFNQEITKKWLPMNAYIGGAEHAVLHLLYSRFVWMALQDWGYIPKELGDEPFPYLFSHGLIIKDGSKMSKSRGNVIIPDDYIEKYGADTLRMYLMFLGGYDQGGDFRDSGISGMYRFLSRVWNTIHENMLKLKTQNSKQETTPKLESKLHETIKKMDKELSKLKYNTSIAALMELFNVWKEDGEVMSKSDVLQVVKLFAPLAPMMSEEIWQSMNLKTQNSKLKTQNFGVSDGLVDSDQYIKGENDEFNSVHLERYPTFDPDKITSDGVLYVVQTNGKKRAELWIDPSKSTDKEYVLEMARTHEGVSKWVSSVKKEIFVPANKNRSGIVNFVV